MSWATTGSFTVFLGIPGTFLAEKGDFLFCQIRVDGTGHAVFADDPRHVFRDPFRPEAGPARHGGTGEGQVMRRAQVWAQ